MNMEKIIPRNVLLHCQPFLYIFCTILSTGLITYVSGSIYVHDLSEQAYKKLGQLNLGIIVPVHYYSIKGFCGEHVRDLGVLQRVEALAYAVDEINNRSDILPNHTLGFVLFDDCYKDVTALAQSLHFIEKNDTGICYKEVPESCSKGTLETYEVVGLIGSESSTTTTQMANLFTSFKIPHVSYLATGHTLNDRHKYPYFMRTVPADTEQATAIVDILEHFNWTYISVVYAQGDYGAEGFKVLQEKTKGKKICIAVEYELKRNMNMAQYQYMVVKLMMETNASVVVVYTPLEEALKILTVAKRLKVRHITWIASDAWLRDINDVMGFEAETLGALSVNIVSSNVSRFDRYFQSLSPFIETDNPWYHEFWEHYHNCTPKQDRMNKFKQCSPDLRFTDGKHYLPDNLVSLVFDTINVIAHAIDQTIQSGICTSNPSEAFLSCVEHHLTQNLRKESIQGETGPVKFSRRDGSVRRSYRIYNIQNGSKTWKFAHVATWNYTTRRLTFTNEKIQWVSTESNKGNVPESICSRPCGKAEQQILQQKRCCWVCEKCTDKQYTDIWPGYKIQRCWDCPNRTWPDEHTRTKCLKIAPDYLKWDDTLGFILGTASLTGNYFE